MANFTKVAQQSEVSPGTGKVIDAGGKKIALFNVDGTFYAVDNTCKHRGGPIGEGDLSGSIVTCPWHGWEYDVRTGKNQENLSIRLGCYQVKVEGDDVLVEI